MPAMSPRHGFIVWFDDDSDGICLKACHSSLASIVGAADVIV
jgi:hypothetical protein